MNKYHCKKVCMLCGREFIGKNTAKYCSSYCQKRNRYLKNKKEKEVVFVTKKCVFCGKEFQCESYKVLMKFCSKKCRDESYKINASKQSRDEYNLRIIKENVILKVNELINKSKSNGITYNGTVIDYCNLSDIPPKTRENILERDHEKCQICNSRKVLHIHHIVKRRNGGSHNEDNLITLCASCHRIIEIGNVDSAIHKCYKNARNNYLNNGIVNTLNRAEINEKLETIFNDIKNNYTNCENVLLKIDELLDEI